MIAYRGFVATVVVVVKGEGEGRIPFAVLLMMAFPPDLISVCHKSLFYIPPHVKLIYAS